MIVYPCMELLKGRCVSLAGGKLDSPAVWHVDPVETARSWAAAGASWMHLSDLDWISGHEGNSDLVLQIIRSVGIPVQLASGFSTADAVAHAIDVGAGRVVLSTLAVLDPVTVKALAKSYPDQIVLSLDVWQGRVMTHGRERESAYTPEAFVAAYNDAPLAGIVVTDLDSDLSNRDAQLGLVSGLAAGACAPVIANGVVRTVDDVARLSHIPNIAGALVGRPLFQKNIDLRAALDVARPQAAPVAEFL